MPDPKRPQRRTASPTRKDRPAIADASAGALAGATDDHDSPWKEALELYFPQALALLAPDLHAVIDWTVPPQFLDKELQSVIRSVGSHGKAAIDGPSPTQNLQPVHRARWCQANHAIRHLHIE